ncbi:hypothetical protein Sjap_015686 [Stephania japonica]|uniref:Uncharacterized protein n=1 Tax=Stephania japonica TaxID=461633 RepID=A0AAP0NSR6_9MAGN
MVVFVSSFLVSITSYLCSLISFINRLVFRNFDVVKNNPNEGKESDQEPEPEVIDFGAAEYEGFGEKETTPRFSFRFQYQPNEEESEVLVNGGCSNKYEFLPGKDFSGFVEEPQVVNFTVKELYADWSEDSVSNKEILEGGFLSEKDFCECSSDSEEPIKEGTMNGSDGSGEDDDDDDDDDRDEGKGIAECLVEEEEELSGFGSDPELVSFGDRFSALVGTMDANSDGFLSEKDFDGEFEPGTLAGMDDESLEDIVIENFDDNLVISSRDEIVGGVEDQSSSPENLADVCRNSETVVHHEGLDFGKEVKLGDHIGSSQESCEKDSSSNENSLDVCQNLEKVELNERLDFGKEVKLVDQVGSSEEYCENNSSIEESLEQHEGSMAFDEGMKSKAQQSECSEESSDKNSGSLETEALIEKENVSNKVENKWGGSDGNVAEPMAGKQKYDEPVSHNSSLEDSEDSSRLEVLWEHQDLIEQLKMELKKVRATGLPTILEESESPRMSDDLKPWNFDEKFLHEDQMDLLHKFYKCYRERMRKFDILNYQKMYAIGFLQHKDPLQSFAMQKPSAPTFGAILSQHLRLHKRRTPEADSVKFVKELQSALEMIYVGQMCLSWEFLHWQYGKAKELLESDPYETRQYNLVAGEFQQFQVLMHRFLENEPFQGPRVQHYIKNRCVLRNLLQVPVIKDDSRDKIGVRRRKDAITCSMLLVIIEESMRVFWDFLRSDKDDNTASWKGLLGSYVELQDPADSELLLQVQTILQKFLYPLCLCRRRGS